MTALMGTNEDRLPPDAFLQPPTTIPPRTSSSNIQNGTNSPGKPGLMMVPEQSTMPSGDKLNTNTDHSIRHSRKRSSVDGTKYRDGTWSQENERIVLGPYNYMSQHPGKDIRRQLIHAFNAWLKVPAESLEVINKVVAMLHTASLMYVPPLWFIWLVLMCCRVDDVEDCSMLRRGIPVAHNIFGTAQTINSANYVYFLALQEVQNLKNPAAIDIYVKELLNLHRGQGMDLFWRDTLTCPSEDDYLEMVGNKTGGLFRLAVKLMQAESDTGKDCVSLVNVMGLIFQICDDFLNLSNTTYTHNKGMCEDLTEGKFSFPIIHSIRSDPHSHQLINILKQKTKDEEVKRYATAYMESTGSFAYTQKFVADLRDSALSLINEIERTDPDGGKDGAMVRAILNKILETTLGDGAGLTHA